MHRGLFIFLLMHISSSIFAQDEAFKRMENPDILKEGIKKMSKETKTIRSEFIQEKYMDILSDILTSKGNITFKKPNKLRWEYTDPFQYLIILNQNKMHIKDDEKTNTIDLEASKVFQEINNLIINIVQGDILDSSKFDIAYFQSQSGFMAKLKTKNGKMKDIINCIEIVFDKEGYSVNRIKLLEPSGDYTNIIFTNRKLNERVDDDAFSIN